VGVGVLMVRKGMEAVLLGARLGEGSGAFVAVDETSGDSSGLAG